MGKKTSVKRKELLVIDDETVVATALFKFKKLFMDESLVWALQLELRTTLPQSYREYDFKFSLNEDPYKMRIKDLEKRKEDIKADSQGDLFPSDGARRTQIKNIEKDIEDTKDELKEALESTPVIEFDGVIDKLEYKNGETIVTFSVPANSVSELNTNRSIFTNYKLELIRE